MGAYRLKYWLRIPIGQCTHQLTTKIKNSTDLVLSWLWRANPGLKLGKKDS